MRMKLVGLGTVGHWHADRMGVFGATRASTPPDMLRHASTEYDILEKLILAPS